MKVRNLAFVLIFLSVAARALAQPPVTIQPADPPGLQVYVGAGQAVLPGGAKVKIAEANLVFDPPETREANVTVKATLNFADWTAAWDPWPPQGAVTLTPRVDDAGVLILGGLFRSVIKDSVVVKSADGAKTFKMGEDYKYNPDWAQIANIAGRLGEPNVAMLNVTYKYALQRLDLLQADAGGKVSVKKGASVIVCPALPEADKGAVAIAGIYIAPWKAADNPNLQQTGKEGANRRQDARDTHGQDAHATTDYAITQFEILPINPAAPVAPIHKEAVIATLAKLQAGGAVKIAIMGASVEVGAEAGPWWDEKIKFTDKDLAWRGRFICGLRKLFPKATITPIEAYEGGKQTKYGLDVLDKTVLPAKPDLVLIDFGGNDVGGPNGKGPNNPPEQFKKDMTAMVDKLKSSGAEVILIVGTQSNPWLKNGQAQRWPEYRKAMLDIGEGKVGVADVYTEWLNLATRGIPPFSQLHNWINHPGPFGHGVFAETILRFFQ